jgi:hypothetical protein
MQRPHAIPVISLNFVHKDILTARNTTAPKSNNSKIPTNSKAKLITLKASGTTSL